MEAQKEKLIDTLNEYIMKSEAMKYEDFNREFETISPKNIIDNLDIIVNDNWNMTTLSLIATITQFLCEDRLAFIVNDYGFITGFQWVSKSDKKEA